MDVRNEAMTELFEKTFAEAAKLGEEDQDMLAQQWILDEFASDKRWNEAFEASQGSLAKLADEARH